MLVRSLPMNAEKVVHDVISTSVTHAGFVHGATDRLLRHKMAALTAVLFATFQHRFLTNLTINRLINCCECVTIIRSLR